MPTCPIRSALLSTALLAATPLAASADPLPVVADPAAPSAPLEYRSPFSGYQRPRLDGVADWRRSNEVVREVGGFAGSLKDPPPPPGGAPAAPGGHKGHSK